jgi:hypothetical protein
MTCFGNGDQPAHQVLTFSQRGEFFAERPHPDKNETTNTNGDYP